MRIFLIILRVGVLLLALAGVGVCGYFGYMGWVTITQNKKLETALKGQAAARALPSREEQQKADSEVELQTTEARIYPFMLAGAVIGLLGGVLALFGRTTSGGVLLLLAGLGPGLFFVLILFFTSPLVMAGLGSFFVSFLAFVTRSRDGVEEDVDEDEESAKPAAKRKSKVEVEDEDEVVVEEWADELSGGPAAGFVQDEDELPAKGGAKHEEVADEIIDEIIDEEFEEPPVKVKAKPSADFEEDEDEPPARKGAKPKDDFEDEDEDEKPAVKPSAKRKRGSDEDEAPEPPAKAGGKRKRS